MTTVVSWVDARTWEEAERILAERGVPESEFLPWLFDRRMALDTVLTRFEDEIACGPILYADHAHVVGSDSAGVWTYRPGDGVLQPIDFHQLAPILSNPNEIDTLGRGVLESKLLHDGWNPFRARWAVAEGTPKLFSRPWARDTSDDLDDPEVGIPDTGDKNGQSTPAAETPLAPILIERGWDRVADDLTALVQGLTKPLPFAWRDPEAIARFLALERPCPDGPSETFVFGRGNKMRDFWWHRAPYPIENRAYELASLLWSADGHSLPVSDVLVKIWGVRLAKQTPQDIQTVRTSASRFCQPFANSGLRIQVRRHRLYGWHEVSLVLPS